MLSLVQCSSKKLPRCRLPRHVMLLMRGTQSGVIASARSRSRNVWFSSTSAMAWPPAGSEVCALQQRRTRQQLRLVPRRALPEDGKDVRRTLAITVILLRDGPVAAARECWVLGFAACGSAAGRGGGVDADAPGLPSDRNDCNLTRGGAC